MHNTKDRISICSFNCRSFKNSLPIIFDICNQHDIVLLQEHWLIPNDLCLLNNAHSDFLSIGLSAVDISSDILTGRPYGGTAILYRKSLSQHIKIIDSDESRISGVRVNTDAGPLLLLNVYMPTNYGDAASLELYCDCLAKLHAVMVDSDTPHTIIAGDFNCSPTSRFFPELTNFANDNNLVLSDLKRLNNIVTYISDDGNKSSWIDHILCSHVADSMLSSICVINDVVISDHKPLSFDVLCSVQASSVDDISDMTHLRRVPMWNKCDNNTLSIYASYLDNLLQQVHVPFDAFDDSACPLVIDQFYNDIFTCISSAVSQCIPTCKYASSDFNVPGWNTYVSEKHDAARQAFLCWLDAGKPKFGYYFDNMKRTRATFKLALRYCRNHIDELKADACAESLFNKDPRKFWKDVYKMSNSKVSCHLDSVGGASGAENVVNMWKAHFQDIYNSNACTKYRNMFNEKVLASLNNYENMPQFSISDIVTAINGQKCGKAAGPDGVQMEAFIHGGPRLSIYLCILFNLFLQHGYVPDVFCQSTIIPLVKCKSGDLSDVNNYRAIALSNSVSKILETLLLDYIESNSPFDEYQFGFRKNLSTTMCTHVFKNTVNYYRQHGSHVFTCFIDFNKAFDNVDYWLLFCKLLDSNDSSSCFCVTRLLASWYSRQLMCVSWQNKCSAFFSVAKGVRQGGILSPFLFRFYIRDLISSITRMNIGCNFAGLNVNLLAYAGDLVLFAPSWRALQCLLNAVQATPVK